MKILKITLLLGFLVISLQSCFETENNELTPSLRTQRIFVLDSIFEHRLNKMELFRPTYFEWGVMGRSFMFYYDIELGGVKNLPVETSDYAYAMKLNEVMFFYEMEFLGQSNGLNKYKLNKHNPYFMEEFWEINFEVEELSKQEDIEIRYTIDTDVYTLYCHYVDVEY